MRVHETQTFPVRFGDFSVLKGGSFRITVRTDRTQLYLEPHFLPNISLLHQLCIVAYITSRARSKLMQDHRIDDIGYLHHTRARGCPKLVDCKDCGGGVVVFALYSNNKHNGTTANSKTVFRSPYAMRRGLRARVSVRSVTGYY